MSKTNCLGALLALGAAWLAVTAEAANFTPDQQAAICGQRASCKVTATDAGQGAQQEKLTIVEVRFGLADKPKDAPDEGCINDSGADNAPDHDGGHEFWLLDGSAAPKRLLALCNDGYGAAGVGADDIKIGPNTITWNETGGSAWRWDVTKKIRLSPLAVVHELDCTFNDAGPGTGQVREIDRQTLKARAVGYVAGQKFTGDDSGGDCPDWPTGPDSTLPTGPKLAGAYAIPMPNAVSNGDSYGAAYPEGTALGDCAVELSTDGLHGFLVYGQPADAASAATVRVAQETTASMLIQVYDPTAAAELGAAKAKSWIGQPHIEIWTDEPGEANADADQGPVMIYHQFAIGLDGKTYPGVHAPKSLPVVTHWQAKDETGRDVTVYRVKWDAQGGEVPAYGLGVVYSQAKDGKQARLVSNAQITKNKPLYLPEAWMNTAEDSGIPSGSCAVNGAKILALVKAP